MLKELRAPDACLAVNTGCEVSSGLLPSMVASARPVEAVLSPSWLMGEESEPTEELLWNSAVSSGIHGVMGCEQYGCASAKYYKSQYAYILPAPHISGVSGSFTCQLTP